MMVMQAREASGEAQASRQKEEEEKKKKAATKKKASLLGGQFTPVHFSYHLRCHLELHRPTPTHTSTPTTLSCSCAPLACTASPCLAYQPPMRSLFPTTSHVPFVQYSSQHHSPTQQLTVMLRGWVQSHQLQLQPPFIQTRTLHIARLSLGRERHSFESSPPHALFLSPSS
jgi:hypothetical protein